MHGLTPDAQLLNDIAVEVFAVNGRFIRTGDAVSGKVGLTSARWQVMGLLQDGPSPVAHLARERGLRRQAVQQTVGRLEAEGMVEVGANPRDRRAPLVHLTPQGKQALDDLDPIEREWMEGLAKPIPSADLKATLRVLRALRGQLDEQLQAADDDGHA
ncbi:MarR family winged helix-turn-helix transcriptional regulator [Amycolatopsis silviterrae]|uniref:MarR family winged helix-turn-helix transcriptional regulator n=1 Tax=Amycolatopsis silviterrae TaxID=1656914 RepID=A0ABW5H6E3_9PSEU